MQASCALSPHASRPALPKACSGQRTRPVEIDPRTHMLLTKPIAPTILRLAIPNATVMIVQILIGLLEVYFVSRTGVDALAGVAPVFPLVSLVVAIAQGALGCQRRAQRCRRGGEGGAEGVPDHLEDLAALRFDGRAQQGVVLRQGGSHRPGMPLPQLRAACDVGE